MISDCLELSVTEEIKQIKLFYLKYAFMLDVRDLTSLVLIIVVF